MSANDFIMDAARQLETAGCYLRLVYWSAQSGVLHSPECTQFLDEAEVNINAALERIQALRDTEDLK